MTYSVLFLSNLNLQFYSMGDCPTGENINIIQNELCIVLSRPVLLVELFLPTSSPSSPYTYLLTPQNNQRPLAPPVPLPSCLPTLGAVFFLFKDVSLSLVKSSFLFGLTAQSSSSPLPK